ncbi:MAG: preprotein translocase subunit SecY, partial [Clostridiales bacterium]|nr:preprotein translocase subunit SecY [Clostridiales bacterium]
GANIWLAVPIIVISAAMIVGVVLVDLAERRIPVQYAKRMVGRKMYGGQGTHIPLKVNATGVLPLIFASAIMQFPATIFSFMSEDIGIARFWNTYMSYTSPWYIVIFAVLVFAFTFFYSSISFNPIEISKNIQQNGGMVPGIRQGKPTSDFIARISRRVTLFGALFLMVLASVPTIIYNLIGFSLPFVASSLLIAVSVAIETTRQLEAQMTMRHYKGFLK